MLFHDDPSSLINILGTVPKPQLPQYFLTSFTGQRLCWRKAEVVFLLVVAHTAAKLLTEFVEHERDPRNIVV